MGCGNSSRPGRQTTVGGVAFILPNVCKGLSKQCSCFGKSARIASPGIEQEGLPERWSQNLIANTGKDQPTKTVPDYVFREERPRPLLFIHVVKPLLKGKDSGLVLPDLIALGPQLPGFRRF